MHLNVAPVFLFIYFFFDLGISDVSSIVHTHTYITPLVSLGRSDVEIGG